MRPPFLIGIVIALAASASGASAQTAQQSNRPGAAPDPEVTALTDAAQAYRRGDCPGTLRLAEPVLKASAEKLPVALRIQSYEIAVDCQLRNNNVDAAYRFARDATALPTASEWLWQLRLGIELRRGRFSDAVASVEAMRSAQPKALNVTPPGWFYSLERELKKQDDSRLRLRLLRALAEAYAPTKIGESNDFFRRNYAELLLGAGDTAGARAQITSITSPWVLAQVIVDPRFRAMFPVEPDLRAAVEQDMAAMRTIMAANPDLLAPMVVVATSLRQLGRPEEALALLETARPRIEGKGKPFADSGDEANWWWDSVGSSEAHLGRIDRAAIAYRAGAAQTEHGAPNVSQVINLAEAQSRAGKPLDALATLAPFDAPLKASAYGNGEMHEAHGCASAMAGKRSAAAEDLAYLRDHPSDTPNGLTDMLLCVGDLDGAASVVIGRLRDPELRAPALLLLSDYDPPVVPLPADPVAAALPTLKARPDVQAAIAQAGGTRRIHLQADAF